MAHRVGPLSDIETAEGYRQMFELGLAALLQVGQGRDGLQTFSCAHDALEQRLAIDVLVFQGNHISEVVAFGIGLAIYLLATRISYLCGAEFGRLAYFPAALNLDQLV